MIILHPAKTNTLRLHRKIGFMLKSWKKINERDKLFKKIKRIDKNNNMEARNEVKKLIRKKKVN